MRIPKNLITNIKVRPSLPFGECLAKTWNNGRTVCGRTVESHCRIAGNVAEILISRFNQLVLNFLPKLRVGFNINKIRSKSSKIWR